MSFISIFDVMGPNMIGPSSSHTAGAARIGFLAQKMINGPLKEVNFTLYGSFARTFKGHGTDRALLGGIMGLKRQPHLHNAPAQQDQADGPDDGKDEGTEVVDNSQRVALGQHRRGGAADQNQSGIQREGAAGQTFGAGHINLVAMHGHSSLDK